MLIPELELSLGLWQGVYRSLDRLWLRWMSLAGDLILLDSEKLVKLQERIRAEERIIEARKRTAELEKQIEQMRAMLLEMGVDPDCLNCD